MTGSGSVKRTGIGEGFEVFAHDGDVAFGAVRAVAPQGRPELVVYVENAGDFVVPFDAVEAVHEQKVILNRGKLDMGLQQAISRAHGAEDPNFEA